MLEYDRWMTGAATNVPDPGLVLQPGEVDRQTVTG